MMIPPAFTGWPPYTLTPLRFDTESRPFLVDPAPFLCAASIIKGWGAMRGKDTGADKRVCTRVLRPQLSCMPANAEVNEAVAIL